MTKKIGMIKQITVYILNGTLYKIQTKCLWGRVIDYIIPFPLIRRTAG